MERVQVFQERLRGLRTAVGLSQQRVADAIGVTKTGYQNYEYARKMPSFETLPKLADVFNVPVDYLLGRCDEPHLPTKEEWELLKQIRAIKSGKQEGKVDDKG